MECQPQATIDFFGPVDEAQSGWPGGMLSLRLSAQVCILGTELGANRMGGQRLRDGCWIGRLVRKAR